MASAIAWASKHERALAAACYYVGIDYAKELVVLDGRPGQADCTKPL
jgi:hypothetical protein